MKSERSDVIAELLDRAMYANFPGWMAPKKKKPLTGYRRGYFSRGKFKPSFKWPN